MNAKLLTLICALALASDGVASKGVSPTSQLIDDSDQPFEPFLVKKHELFRYSRAAKGGLFAKYEQRQEQLKQQQIEQQQQQLQQQQQVSQLDQTGQQVDLDRSQEQSLVAGQLPEFSSLKQPQNNVQVQRPVQAPVKTFAKHSHAGPQSVTGEGQVSVQEHVARVNQGPLTEQVSQDNHVSQVGQKQVVTQLHTVPLSRAVHYTNYVIVPSAKGPGRAASLKSSSSSRKSSSSSSSSFSSTDTKSVSEPVVEEPVQQQQQQLQQELVVQEPLVSKGHRETSVKSIQAPTHFVQQSTLIEGVGGPPVAPVCCLSKGGAKFQTSTSVDATPQGEFHEEHFHSETHSSRHESNGQVHSSSSSTSSSSARRSSNLKSASNHASAPAFVQSAFQQPTAPGSVKTTLPLTAVAHEEPTHTTGTKQINRQYFGPGIKYSYSVKQISSAPVARGTVLTSRRVVYLR